MTALLPAILGVYAAYMVYIAAVAGRRLERVEGFLDGGGSLPGWTLIFAGVGIVIAALGLDDHLRLVAVYGLQASHVAMGLTLVGLTAALLHKRLWIAARLSRVRSPIELLGAYYDSVGLRVLLFGLTILFALPFAACSLVKLGNLLEAATAGAIARGPAIWTVAFTLFLASALGGWRGIVYGIAALSGLLIVLLVLLGGFVAMAGDAHPGVAPAVPAGTLADKIPGVMQYSRGLGKDVALGGPWTAGAIFSFALSLTGIVLSPGFGFLAVTTTSRSGFAFSQVWMVAALGGGLLLLAAPLLAGLMATPDHPAGIAALADHLGARDGGMAVLSVVMIVVACEIAVAFFVASAAQIVTLDLVGRFMLPDLAPAGRRLASRVTLGLLFASAGLLAWVAPLPSTLLASVTLSLSAQLLPALLGLCWVPWISRSAVLTGLIVAIPIVLFTEPPGLVLFEGLFLDMPWGRWPLTIHSALWGLTFNVAACLLVSIFTRGGEERAHREILHRALARDFAIDFGGPAARGAKWSLTLIWAFLALGPGAILGNDFFSHPIFTDSEAALGVPSLWVWQIAFWFLGVLLVWWLAYPVRLGILDQEVTRTVDLAPAREPLQHRRAAPWIALALERLTRREARPLPSARSKGAAPRTGFRPASPPSHSAEAQP